MLERIYYINFHFDVKRVPVQYILASCKKQKKKRSDARHSLVSIHRDKEDAIPDYSQKAGDM